MVTMNKELEELVFHSNIPGNKDSLYNWVIDHKEQLLKILMEGGELERVYWDDEPIWRERIVKKLP